MRRTRTALTACLVGTSLAAPADGRGTNEDPLTARVHAAIREAVAGGRLAVFAPGEHQGDAWGSLCLGGVSVSGGGERTLSQTAAFHRQRYFYPASTVKLYAAIAAYEQMNALAEMHPEAGLSERTALRFHPLFGDDTVRETDPARERSTVPFGEPPITIEHEAHKVFVVSDNPAFNTLYDFVGQRDLYHRIRAWGAGSTMITHRLAVARTESENRRAPRIDLGLTPGDPQIGERYSTLPHPGPDRLLMPDESMLLGTGYVRSGETVREPFDFSTKNFTTLSDLQLVLVRLLFPDIAERSVGSADGVWTGPLPGRPLDLTDDQREQLIASATMYPRQSESPKYDPAEYPDDHVKFLLPGLLKVRPLQEWRVVNKIGLAYGFVTENAYVEHRPTGNAVFVAAVIHRNPNGIYNDNQYDYETTLSEMATLGEVVGRALVGEE